MGVPPGSILGPLLFTLYINELTSTCGDDIKIQMYADETVIHKHGNDTNQVADKLSIAMENVSKWLNQSCLTINVGNSGILATKKHMDFPNITVNGETIDKAAGR